MLMVGSHGSGKTLLARALPGILPEMSKVPRSVGYRRSTGCHQNLFDCRSTSARHTAHSPAPVSCTASHHQPCRAGRRREHSAPGEISLAHRGILFLDEFLEFGTRVLEVMRQPMEDKVVTISRAQGSLTFSANFQLISATNPCPCGWHKDPLKPCTCAPSAVTKSRPVNTSG
jgi:magnesium chelatase family protein